MKRKGKQTLTPKLRFPEFRVGEGWQTPPLSDLYGFKRTNTLSRDKLNYKSGTIRNIHYGDIHTKFRPLFRVDEEYVPFINPEVSVDAFKDEDDCEEGDIVLADASDDLNDVGKAIEVVSLDGQRVVAGTHTILATRRRSVPILGFGGHLFQSATVRAGIQRESQGAKVYGISAKRISPVALPLPPTKQEQQKIAECLNSLDGLIAAEGRMLEALKAHKKGLMQQLFLGTPTSPSAWDKKDAGEDAGAPRQPRLRFPEFLDKQRTSTLGEVVRLQSGGTPSKSNPAYWNGSIPWVSAKSMKRVFLSDAENHLTTAAIEDGAKQVPAGTVLMLIRGMTLLKDVPVCITQRSMCFNQDVKALHATKILDAQYLLYLLLGSKSRLLKMVGIAGHGTGRFNTDELKGLDINLPKLAEQHRIAACLTSLDNRIAAQAAKIDTLKQHKRGLMQQLFPSLEEVNA